MRNFICLLLFLSLLLGGCRPAVSPAGYADTQTTPPTPETTEIRITLESCIVGNKTIQGECGELIVPEDRTNPGGRALKLGIVVVRARQPNPEPDPLFYIAGGPGNAATDDYIVSSAHTIFWKINARRDIIFLDQRGTNGEHRLACEAIPFAVADATQQQMDNWMKQCLSGLDGDPRFYTSAEAMRDLDQARAALGYDKINLYGISYGAAAIQVYMRMFPEHFRAAVIDHGTALDLPFAQAFARASQSALDQIFTYCEQDEKCHTAYPDIRGDWKAVLDRLAEGPVETSFQPPEADAPAVLTMDGLVEGVHNLMYKSGSYTQIPFIIHTLATNEDWAPVLKSYYEQYGSSGQADEFLLMKNIIFCFEPAWGFLPDQVTEIARLSQGSYYGDLEVKVGQNVQKICASLPEPDPSLIYPPGKPAPLSALIFNSLIDPQNPPSNMDLALKEFTKSRVVVEPTEGHDTTGSQCRWEIVSEYIEEGSVDALDISCMESQEPSFVIGE